jgi:hypothetical protein
VLGLSGRGGAGRDETFYPTLGLALVKRLLTPANWGKVSPYNEPVWWHWTVVGEK